MMMLVWSIAPLICNLLQTGVTLHSLAVVAFGLLGSYFLYACYYGKREDGGDLLGCHENTETKQHFVNLVNIMFTGKKRGLQCQMLVELTNS